jgi:hypothetical protein
MPKKLMKTLVAFDIDGTILTAPPSLLSLTKYFFRKKHFLNLETAPLSPIARKIDDYDDYGIFALFAIRKPSLHILSSIKKLNKDKKIDLAIISGRGKKLLQNITILELKKHQVLPYFKNQIFLKPGNFKSSTTWKLHCLKDFCQKYEKVVLVDNDLISSLEIGTYAKKQKLPIQIFLIKTIETSPFILKLLKITRQTLENAKTKIVSDLNSLHDKILP